MRTRAPSAAASPSSRPKPHRAQARPLARPEIVALQPYEHAAWEPRLERMHANELPWRAAGDHSAAGLNRYPEPQPRALVEALARLYGVGPGSVLVGRGSDEAIDLLTRAFCRAGMDSVIVCPPTFGMYAVAARIQGAEITRVPLRAAAGFALDEAALLDSCSERVKLVFVCSPNNPTGNLLEEAALLRLAAALAGRALLVIDEAYVEFAAAPSMARHVASHPYLAVLRTLSKAHALAGARCGTLIAAPEIVALLRKVIPPYALGQHTIETVLAELEPGALGAARGRIAAICAERERLAAALGQRRGVRKVWPSDANFLLVEFDDPSAAFARACAAGLLVRDVRSQPGLDHALRITIGSAEQNARLLEAWR
jgi:histidinol-phosphate aminotransferase